MWPNFKTALLNRIKAVSPATYKGIFFKKFRQLNWENIKGRNIENEFLLLPFFLQKGSVFFDVGANLGQYVYMAGRIAGEENIYAFEPNPELSSRLRQIFPKTNVITEALSSSEGTARFKIPLFDERVIHTRGTLRTDHMEHEETNARLLDVKLNTLDAFTGKMAAKKISMVKIDVEGAEFEVIKGAAATLQEFRPILMVEIEQRHHNEPIQAKISSIEKDFAYTCYYLDPIRQCLMADFQTKSIEDLQDEAQHSRSRLFINNFIFIPNEAEPQKMTEAINNKIKSGQLS